MIWLYRLLYPLILLALAPGYLTRMRRRGGYGENFQQRFGRHPRLPRLPPPQKRVWLQAVSVGEMLAIAPLLEGLRSDGVSVYLTTTTSTGYRLASDRYRNLTEGIGYFPLDWRPFSIRAWDRIRPDLIILTEGERWPEHMAQAQRRGVPILAINARLSDRSFRRLRAWGWLPGVPRLLLQPIARLLAGSTQDERRFRDLGYPIERMTMTGNIKMDVAILALSEAEKADLREKLGLATGLVLLGSSTWPGEEAALVAALVAAREEGIACRLLLVPRHAERRLEIERLLRATGLSYHLRSRGPAAGEVDVAVGDTTGELRRLTQLADLVFVGKSLPPHTEGQTPVEAAALEKPIIFGPGMGNFAVIARDLRVQGAARRVEDAAGLAAAVAELLRDGAKRQALAEAASAWHAENRGAVGRTLAIIREELAKLR